MPPGSQKHSPSRIFRGGVERGGDPCGRPGGYDVSRDEEVRSFQDHATSLAVALGDTMCQCESLNGGHESVSPASLNRKTIKLDRIALGFALDLWYD